MNRRDVIKTGAAGLAMSMVGAQVAKAAEQKTYRVGLIGTGWFGKNDLFRLLQVRPAEVVSVCDVDKNQSTAAAELIAQRQKSKKAPRIFGDYREMLKDKDLDVVVVGTPDHWHALCAIAAMEAGAHVYVQKPISCDVLEGEAMVAAARRLKKVVQVGTQRKSQPHLVEAKKNIIDAGLLGKIGQVDICCYYHMRFNTDLPPIAPPENLDFEMWTGPAPLRPYQMLPHRGWWRAFMEYGNGIVGDMCVHMLDTTRFMLGLRWPKRISSGGGIFVDKGGKANITDTQTALFEYDDLNITWQHRTWGSYVDQKYPWSMTFHGDKGTLKACVDYYDFTPEGTGDPIHKDCVYEREQYPEDVTEKDIDLSGAPATRANMKNFFDCIENGGRPKADIEEGHISTASCIMANLSMQLGRPLVYDPTKRQVVGDPGATALLRRPYRAPWKHPAEGLA